ncbi:unnamed protein product [Linum trigynum]|uniref:Uncharacterized protein n=1 Tax=Linum trigynum TaxID=586398 RepID=A0AAV2FDA3_9ROSI
MCPPSLNPNAEIGFDCTPEEICSSLRKMMKGSPLSSNVVDDICPYIYTPSNLPAGIWYLIEKSMEKDKETETGLRNKQAKESSSLCRVFIEQEHINHKREEVDAQNLVFAASSTNSSGSTSKAEGDRAVVADQLADDLEADDDCYAQGD